MMSPVQACCDTTEATELCEAFGLYLKPLVKVNISVQLPQLKMPGQSISSWEVMEKLKNMIKTDAFTSLKVSKTTLDFIRFEGELEKKSALKNVLHKLESSTMKLSGFPDVLKVRVAPAKLKYPARHDWDSFFRDAKNVNEMKPGERPDTVYIQDLPSKWFADEKLDPLKPSEQTLKSVFETFGDVRRVEIPPRKTGDKTCHTFGKINTLSFNQDLVFEAYIQFKEYVGFVKAMDSLRGMKLMFKSDDGKAHCADIKVDFDRTNYLSDRCIWKRSLEKLKVEEDVTCKKRKIPEQVIMKCENDEKEKEVAVVSVDDEKLQNKLPECSTASKHEVESTHLLKALLLRCENSRLANQQPKLVDSPECIQEKSSIEKTNLKNKRKETENKNTEIAEILVKECESAKQKSTIESKHSEMKEKVVAFNFKEDSKQKLLLRQEKILRERLLKAFRERMERKSEENREKLRKELAGKNILRSVLVTAERKDKTAKVSAKHSMKMKSFCTKLKEK